ncbi:MAG: tRNA (uridine(34)/cytosine(34)/5-carboxymethylaminomethyluridine(34)-2'-O)-methyltransferase TrmL [Candidatus Cloacimonetes bacterium]|nr:tRNA (uridine(34)/cytosine(34)/5-carboxymethylaminomethyluridine(34)-2'-O)-methyltransferase TrmL [Candidatus Cloacimonadota bacterium]
MTFKIVLYQPEIPINTGNIGRLCLGANAELHIIKPMRFFINDKYLKRAGMDYWDKVQLFIHDDFDTFLKSLNNNRIFFCTTKSTNSYHINQYKIGDVFVFGPESRGLPEDMLNKYKNDLITIPMHKEIRSINLCNSVSIILYEALRQQNFSFLV